MGKYRELKTIDVEDYILAEDVKEAMDEIESIVDEIVDCLSDDKPNVENALELLSKLSKDLW